MASVIAVSSAFAADLVPFNSEIPAIRKDFMAASPYSASSLTRATENTLPTNMWGYNCDAQSWTGFNSQITDLRVASEFNEDIVNALAGKTIKQLAITAPALTASKSLDMSLFISYDLESDPIAEIEFKSSGCPVNNQGYITALKYEVVDLPEPITIEAGKPFYVGYSAAVVKKGNYAMSFDGVPYDGQGLLYTCKENEYEWLDATAELGAACIFIGLDEIPENMVRVVQSTIPGQVAHNSNLEGDVTFINIGGNDVTSLTSTITIGDQTPVEYTATKSNKSLYKPGSNGGVVVGDVAPRSFGMALFADVPVSSVGILPVSVNVDKVNGNANLWSPSIIENQLIVLEEGTGYDRNVVIEEGTGTWCGWCVRGYVGMEYMSEKYNDGSYIGIAVHSGDAMEAESYVPMVQNYFSGFPSAVVNRSSLIDPGQEELEQAYLNSVALPAYGKVDLKVDGIDGDNLSVTSTSEFIFSEPCLVAYVIKEDNVGPYSQTNYYSGGGNGAMGGFENKGQNVRLTFNEVARDIKDAFGLAESLPDNIEAGKQYTHSTKISLENVKDVDNAYVIAMLINQNDGSIINAKQVKLEGSGVNVNGISTEDASAVSTAKGSIIIKGNCSADVFTLDGRKVAEIDGNSSANVAAGIYVVRVAGSAVKVVVK